MSSKIRIADKSMQLEMRVAILAVERRQVVAQHVAREGGGQCREGIVDGVHNTFHFVPFTKAQRYALLGGFHFRLTVGDIEFPEVDALVARRNGDVVATTDVGLVLDQSVVTQRVYGVIDVLYLLTKASPPATQRTTRYKLTS